MGPEDIDELFKGRLGNLERTPSSEAWQRLQQQLQPPPKRRVIPMWWSVAATVAFLVLTGYFLFVNQLSDRNPEKIANTRIPAQQPTTLGEKARPSLDPATVKESNPETVAAATSQEGPETKDLENTSTQSGSSGIVAATQPAEAAVSSRLSTATLPGHGKGIPAKDLPQQSETPPMVALDKPAPRPAQITTSASAAPAAETIEVVILKQEPSSLLAGAGELVDEGEESSPSRKGKLVKGIFKQVKNLAAGEKIDLSQIGLDRYSLAIETQIGNRKISKTINF